MSFVDLGTLTMHRRAEMEGRINTFDEKCDRAISDIKKLKTQARGFLTQLNCDPAELKDRFLNVMKKLDEYTYLITDFNLALGQIEESSDQTPVLDESVKPLPPPFNFSPNNLMDVLSEPAPSVSSPCTNLCPPEKQARVKVPKQDQALISFSSSSTSSESVPNRRSEVAKEVQRLLPKKMEAIKLEEARRPPSPECSLPAQSLLQVEMEYRGVITGLSGACFWLITDDSQELSDFIHDIKELVERSNTTLTIEQARALTYCVYYDEETDLFYRAMIIREDQEEADKLSLFLVDTGELRAAPAHMLRPLPPALPARPPYARLCHLAGIDMEVYNDKEMLKKYEGFMTNYISEPCTFIVDENESESTAVFVICSGKVVNDLLVDRGLAVPIDKGPVHLQQSSADTKFTSQTTPEVRHSPQVQADTSRLSPYTRLEEATYSPHLRAEATSYSPHSTADYSPHSTTNGASYSQHSTMNGASYLQHLSVTHGPPELVGSALDLDGPEYDDPVVAVTGYHNRDEEDICKHFRGGPDKTCFKGTRCTKKHILKHLDGWTMDRVPVAGKLESLPLPAPRSWLKVQVTSVAHFDRIYVNLIHDNLVKGDQCLLDNMSDFYMLVDLLMNIKKEEVPEFGVVLPPKTLSCLIRDMNSAAAKSSYRPLTLTPAPGELVAACYPPDGQWYRARVLTVTRPDQSVEVQYVDYGTTMWVKEDQVRALEARYCVLPAQAIRCVLAGVYITSQESHEWVRAKRALADVVQDRVLHAHVISRDYDEITVELVDDDDYSIAQQLAAQGVFELRDYSVCDDTHVTQKMAVP